MFRIWDKTKCKNRLNLCKAGTLLRQLVGAHWGHSDGIDSTYIQVNIGAQSFTESN